MGCGGSKPAVPEPASKQKEETGRFLKPLAEDAADKPSELVSVSREAQETAAESPVVEPCGDATPAPVAQSSEEEPQETSAEDCDTREVCAEADISSPEVLTGAGKASTSLSLVDGDTREGCAEADMPTGAGKARTSLSRLWCCSATEAETEIVVDHDAAGGMKS